MRDLSPYVNALSGKIIGACLEVHRTLGPGLLESIYEEALSLELSQRGLKTHRQQVLPIYYKDVRLKGDYRMDLLVENLVIVELKSCEHLLPVHEAQILTYMKLARKDLGLLINFNTALLKDGIKRFVLTE